MIQLNLHDILLQLLPEKAVYRPDSRTLYLADTHFGKAGTFRRGGIPLPGGHNDTDFRRLDGLIGQHQPDRIVFLGDLFHSDFNAEWREFAFWRDSHPDIRMLLIQGNHDVLHGDDYAETGLVVQQEGFHDDGLMLNHHPLPDNKTGEPDLPVLCGHVHPGVRLSGPGRQFERLPCFWHSARQKQLMLPAFGSFTGLGTISPEPEDDVFVVAGDQVVQM